MAGEKFKKIKGFDGIRGLAVISVVLTHVGLFSFLHSSPYLKSGVLPLVHGPTGVQAFFVLSGFLITMLLIKEHRANSRISLKNFFYRRILRIIPLYLLFLIAVIVIQLFVDYVSSWKSLLYASTYTYNFIPTWEYSKVLGHTWSLAVEEHFYLIWPILFSAWYSPKRRGLLLGLAVFVVAAIAARIVIGNMWWYEKFYFVDRWSFIAGCNIALGCMCAILIYGDQKRSDWRRLLGGSAALGAGVILFLNSILLGDFHISTYIRGVGIALVISWICLNQKSALTKWLEFRPLQYTGIISYGIYIYQGLYLGTGPDRAPGQEWPPNMLVGIVLLVISAPLSYHWFEKPFLKLKTKYSSVKYNRRPTRKETDQKHLGMNS